MRLFRNILILIFLLLLCIEGNAQPFFPPTGIRDEGGTEKKPVYTINCVGNGIECSQNGITGTITVEIRSMPPGCVLTDDWCMLYNNTDSQLILYVNGAIQVKWPFEAVSAPRLLLESGELLLLENGTDAILLE